MSQKAPDDLRELVGLSALMWAALMLSLLLPIALCGWLTLTFTDRVVSAGAPCECEVSP